MVKCTNPECGEELQENSFYCNHCGKEQTILQKTSISSDSDSKFLSHDDYCYPDEETIFKKLVNKVSFLGWLDIAIDNVVTRIEKGDLKGENILITEKQYPDIFKQIMMLCSIFGIEKPPNVYRRGGERPNAFTSGIAEPFIVITSKLLEMLSPKERLYVLAHEFAHIKSEHVRFIVLSRGVFSKMTGLPGIGSTVKLVDILVKFGFLKWSRAAEYTADRAGYLVTQSLSDCCSTLSKLALRANKLNEFNMSEYIRNAREIDKMDWLAQLNKLDETHPYGPLRLRELIRFASSNEGVVSMDKARKIIKRGSIAI